MVNNKSTSHWLNKVPEVGLIFWVIKIMTTTVGETAADFLSFNLQLGLPITTIFVGALFLLCLIFQFRQSQYMPAIYWTTVTLVSVLGTLITDNLTDNFGVPLAWSSGVFALLLFGTFLLWYLKEKTLSIHAINTRNREFFYWLAILMTFALGTAVGDFVAEALGWGYAQSGFVFGSLILLITLTYYLLRANAVICFWFAYVLTRPLGASLGDYLTQSANQGGLNLASHEVNLFFLITIIGLVSYLIHQQKKRQTGVSHE